MMLRETRRPPTVDTLANGEHADGWTLCWQRTRARLRGWFGRTTGQPAVRPAPARATAATTAPTPPWPAALAPAHWSSDTALRSETGPVRDHNEDRVAALNRARGEAQRTALVVLADGMGGHSAGDVASRVAVQAALAQFGEPADDVAPAARPQRERRPGTDRHDGRSLAQRLHEALAAANDAVQAAARAEPAHAGMGTTLLLLAFGSHGAWVGWVGDSRLYRWRDGAVEQLTRDDTVVMDLHDAGLLDGVAVATHPDRSVLTQAVGTQRAIPRPHVRGPIDYRHGDRFLLCSDGLHDVLPAPAIAEALAADSAGAAVERLHRLALARRSDDNLSSAVVRIVCPPGAALGTRPPRPTRDALEVPA